MNYQKIYDSIVERARGRKKFKRSDTNFVYYENHHVIPRCLGGSDDKINIVCLTPEEHWLAHLLLVKINPGNNKLVFACHAMCMTKSSMRRTNNKLFGWIRREYGNATSERQKGIPCQQVQKEKISATLKGRPAVHQQGENNVAKRPEVAKKISDANRGRKKVFSDPEQRGQKISLAKLEQSSRPPESNPYFRGYIIAKSILEDMELKLTSKKDMKSHGFSSASVYRHIKDGTPYKGYIFTRDPL